MGFMGKGLRGWSDDDETAAVGSPYVILCVDDEKEVLTGIRKDLEYFEDAGFSLEIALSVDEAWDVVRSYPPGAVALVLCDQLMPGKKGVDFLIELEKFPSTKQTKKVLVTGQATHEDTIQAINIGGLDHYIAKPWDPQVLGQVVKKLLTDFVIAYDSSPARFASVLDFARIMEAVHAREV